MTFQTPASSTATVPVAIVFYDATEDGGKAVDVILDNVRLVKGGPSNNTPPSITFPPGNTDQTTLEDTPTSPISFLVNDAESPVTSLRVKGTSSNPVLVADSDIVISGNGGTRTVKVTPRPDQSGTAVITLVVTDPGGLTNSISFNLTVQPVDDRPKLVVPTGPIVTTTGVTPSPVPFSVSDPDTPIAQLVITATSADQSLIPNENLKLTVTPGTIVTNFLTIIPAPGKTGATEITLTVSDHTSSVSTFIDVIVKANTAPTITKIPDLTINRNTTTNLLFQIGDGETPSTLSLTVSSSNPALIPTNQLVFLGSGSNRQLEVHPVPGQTGTSDIKVTVSDGELNASTTFKLTVVVPNTPPVISPIPNQSVASGGVVGPLAFTIYDAETPADQLPLGSSSSNEELIPVSAIVFGGSGTNRTVKITPVAGKEGTSSINIKVQDGSITAITTFVVSVTSTAGRQLLVQDTAGVVGGTVSIPIHLTSQGNENALGFSIEYPRSPLSYVSASIGSGVTNGSLNINTAQNGEGRLGFTIALPSGQTFAAGKREVLVLNFLVLYPASTTANAILTFGDVPVAREVADVTAAALPTGYSAGLVTFSAFGLEGDVTPRSNPNGAVTIADWVQVGRFAAGLDTAINGPEFQRADCAPRSQNGALVLGNGTITVADWVQAGRYAAGLDPATVAGGPVNAVGKSSASAGGAAGKAGLGSRILKLVSSADGLSVDVVLSGPGGEAGAGFSVDFNAAGLRFVSAEPGAGLNGGSLIVNDLAAGTGRIGFALAAPQGGSFGQSPATLARLHFASAAASTTSPVHFSDEPIARELVDAAVNTLSVRYVNSDASGDSTAVDGGQLVIRRSGNAVVLSWPASLGSGALEQTGDLGSGSWQPVAGNPQSVGGQYELEVGTGGAASFFRLHTP